MHNTRKMLKQLEILIDFGINLTGAVIVALLIMWVW